MADNKIRLDIVAQGYERLKSSISRGMGSAGQMAGKAQSFITSKLDRMKVGHQRLVDRDYRSNRMKDSQERRNRQNNNRDDKKNNEEENRRLRTKGGIGVGGARSMMSAVGSSDVLNMADTGVANFRGAVQAKIAQKQADAKTRGEESKSGVLGNVAKASAIGALIVGAIKATSNILGVEEDYYQKYKGGLPRHNVGRKSTISTTAMRNYSSKTLRDSMYGWSESDLYGVYGETDLNRKDTFEKMRQRVSEDARTLSGTGISGQQYKQYRGLSAFMDKGDDRNGLIKRIMKTGIASGQEKNLSRYMQQNLSVLEDIKKQGHASQIGTARGAIDLMGLLQRNVNTRGIAGQMVTQGSSAMRGMAGAGSANEQLVLRALMTQGKGMSYQQAYKTMERGLTTKSYGQISAQLDKEGYKGFQKERMLKSMGLATSTDQAGAMESAVGAEADVKNPYRTLSKMQRSHRAQIEANMKIMQHQTWKKYEYKKNFTDWFAGKFDGSLDDTRGSGQGTDVAPGGILDSQSNFARTIGKQKKSVIARLNALKTDKRFLKYGKASDIDEVIAKGNLGGDFAGRLDQFSSMNGSNDATFNTPKEFEGIAKVMGEMATSMKDMLDLNKPIAVKVVNADEIKEDAKDDPTEYNFGSNLGAGGKLP